MIISVEKLKEYITTDEKDAVLEVMLQALEASIRKKTNNNFQQRAYRVRCNASMANGLEFASELFNVGDTVQVSDALLNLGVYTITEIDFDNAHTKVNALLMNEKNVLVTKIVYPTDVIEGAVEIMRWKLKNKAANSGDTSKKDIASETISRHSVTYVQDATESDIDSDFGVPRKYLAFLKDHKKARF